MKNIQNQMQQDISNQANNLITQLYCAERGLDYNQVMHSAYQQQLAHIRQHAAIQQEQRMVKQYYQRNGGSVIAKIRDVFAPEDFSLPVAPTSYAAPGYLGATQSSFPVVPQMPAFPSFGGPQAVPDFSVPNPAHVAPLAFVSDEERQSFEQFKQWQAQNAEVPKQQHFTPDVPHNTNG